MSVRICATWESQERMLVSPSRPICLVTGNLVIERFGGRPMAIAALQFCIKRQGEGNTGAGIAT